MAAYLSIVVAITYMALTADMKPSLMAITLIILLMDDFTMRIKAIVMITGR
jgi:hypothetical protein